MANLFKRRVTLATLFFVFLLAAVPRPKLFGRQEGQQAQQGGSPFRVVKSMVGSKGVAQGAKFVVEDLRTTFRVPQDKQVVVYFEWEGPPGAHHFQGTWIEPSGKVEGTGTFDYVSPGRDFSGYWILQLNKTVPYGLWALEAQIDGKPAGEKTFRITGPPVPPPPAPTPSTAQIYQQVLASSVFLTALDAQNEPIRTGSGFFIHPGIVATTFGVIDGSTSLLLQLPDGSTQTTAAVLGANREQDWALLAVPGTKIPPLKLARPGSWKVGDVCYVTDSPSPGARSIVAVAITGILKSGVHGRRFTISWNGSGRAMGSPVLNTYGKVIGIVGESPDFGANGVPLGTGLSRLPLAASAGPQVISAAIVPTQAPTSQPTTLAELAARGLFIMPVARDSQIVYGYLCRGYQREGDSVQPNVVTSQFFHRDGKIAVLVMWDPNRKVKSTDQVRVYDDANRLVLQSKPTKLHLGRHTTAYTGWKMPISTLLPGVYRVDVILGNTPEWRSFFRLSE